MATSVTMPQLGESVTEGTVTRWLKEVGDEVTADEPLLEVSTDKVDTEIPAPASGVLTEIKAGEDDVVEVGGELAVIADAAEAGSASSPQAPESEPASEPAPVAEPAPAPDPAPTTVTSPTSSHAAAGSVSVELPALGESVTEGTVTRWLKQVGDEVSVDEPLLEVSTDKVDTEIPSPVAGVLSEIRVNEDETVEVGSVLAVIGSPGSQPATAPEPEAAPAQSAPAPAPEAPHQRRHPRLHLRLPRLPRPLRGLIRWRLRHPDRAQAGQREGSRSVNRQGHRRRRPDPQAGRTRCRQRQSDPACCSGGSQCTSRESARRPATQLASEGPDRADEPAAKGHRHPHGRVAGGLRAVDHRH